MNADLHPISKSVSYTCEETQGHFVDSFFLLKKNVANIVATANSTSSRHTSAVVYIDSMSGHSAEWMKELFWRYSQQPGLQTTSQLLDSMCFTIV